MLRVQAEFNDGTGQEIRDPIGKFLNCFRSTVR